MSLFDETSHLYTPLSSAVKQLHQRRGDHALVTAVNKYFQSNRTPSELLAKPQIIIAPPVVSPNLELEYVLDITQHTGMDLLAFEYGRDKFVHMNFEKRHLGEMFFCKKSSVGTREVTKTMRIVDFELDQGKRFDEIKTSTGEGFIQFHHRLVRTAYPDRQIHINDFSDWFEASRLFDKDLPYLRYLGLFLCDAILLTNFVTEKSQRLFTSQLVVPAFAKLRDLFGVDPLIVPIEPIDTDHSHLWCYYDEHIESMI